MKKASLATLLLTAAMLCACGEAAQPSTETTAAITEAATETTAEVVTEDPYADDRAAFDALPALDLGGAEFKKRTYPSTTGTESSGNAVPGRG